MRDPGDADEISVEGEHSRSVLESDGCDQRVNRRQRDPLCAPLAKDGGGIPVRRESTRLQHFPLREVVLYLADTSRVRPCRNSATMTPVSTKGSDSAIMRCNSTPARPGEEFRKSIQMELSTRIKSDFSGRPSCRPSRCRFRSGQGSLFDFPSARATPEPFRRFAVWSLNVSASVPCGPRFR